MSTGSSSAAGRVVDLLAVAQHRDDVGDGLHLLEPVGNVEDRDALGLQLADEVQERRRLDRRQRGGRLVEDDDAMGNGQRAGDLRQLPLRDRQPLDRHGRRAPRRRTPASPPPRAGSSPGRRRSRPRRASRPRNMFSAIVRSGASMIS